MPSRLLYSKEDYLNLFVIYGECVKVVSRTCEVFAACYPEKQKLSPKAKLISDNFRNTKSVKRKTIKVKQVLNNASIEIQSLYFSANFHRN